MSYASGRHFLQIPGPTNIPDRILRAIDQPVIDHRGPEFAALGREVLAGIRTAYDPETLIGRHVIIVANLEPRKMRFGTSEGMLLAAGPGGEDIYLVSPDTGAQPGMRVR